MENTTLQPSSHKEKFTPNDISKIKMGRLSYLIGLPILFGFELIVFFIFYNFFGELRNLDDFFPVIIIGVFFLMFSAVPLYMLLHLNKKRLAFEDDLKDGCKIVLKAPVTHKEVIRRSSKNSTSYYHYLTVGEKKLLAEEIYHQVAIGDWVEISYAPHSDTTLTAEKIIVDVPKNEAVDSYENTNREGKPQQEINMEAFARDVFAGRIKPTEFAQMQSSKPSIDFISEKPVTSKETEESLTEEDIEYLKNSFNKRVKSWAIAFSAIFGLSFVFDRIGGGFEEFSFILYVIGIPYLIYQFIKIIITHFKLKSETQANHKSVIETVVTDKEALRSNNSAPSHWIYLATKDKYMIDKDLYGKLNQGDAIKIHRTKQGTILGIETESVGMVYGIG